MRSGGFGRAKNKCTNFERASDLITVTLPGSVIYFRPNEEHFLKFIYHYFLIKIPNIKHLRSKDYS